MRNDRSGRAPANPADRVLLVEDEQRLRDMLVRAVGEMGYPVTGVGSAEAALRALEKEPAGILILDLNLPGMEGMTLLAAVRKRRPTIQAIILTGFGDLAAAKQAIHLDVVDFLTKPCALGDLEIALDRARRRAAPRVPEVLDDATGEAVDDEESDEPAEDWDEEAERAEQGASTRSPHSAESAESAAATAGETSGGHERQAGGLEFLPRESSEALSMEDIERQHILAALQKHGGNRSAAAEELGISLRKLYYRIAQYQKRGQMP